MAEFTKGPWSIEMTMGGKPFGIMGPDPKHDLDLICGFNTRAGDNEANARLIAAAPELLAACEGLLAVYEELNARFDMGDCDETIAARAAIQKARTP